VRADLLRRAAVMPGRTDFRSAYNLTAGGVRVTDLRLSGTTLAKIFTRQVTGRRSIPRKAIR